jgi:hypothetical protein
VERGDVGPAEEPLPERSRGALGDLTDDDGGVLAVGPRVVGLPSANERSFRGGALRKLDTRDQAISH